MNETTQMLADTADRLFGDAFASGHELPDDGLDPQLWAAVAEVGLPLVFVPEAAGGIGAGWAEALVVMRAMGRHAVALPLPDTLLAGRVLAAVGLEIPEGPLAVASRATGGVRKIGGGYRFDGELTSVAWGRCVAGVVTAIDDTVVLVKPSDAQSVTRRANLAGEPRDRLVFIDAPAVVASADAFEAGRLFDEAALLNLGQVAGALAAALERSIGYACNRKQFGRPIAQFQSVQQSLAVFGEEAAVADCAATSAFAAAARGDAGFEIACARLRAQQAIEAGASIAHQLHGAIGFTREYDLRRFTQRLMAWRSEHGTDAYWAQRLGTAIAARGVDRFWPDLTARSDAAAFSSGDEQWTAEKIRI
ncbi:MAG TPA: acyl-CoA dehydrogenase family protein [Nevskiaceae bacterium]|nr:acyl-CoA dehydrogenase family protein [Nevskiaceae bacterium]